MLVLHAPNDSPKERPKFFEIHETQEAIRLQAVVWQRRNDDARRAAKGETRDPSVVAAGATLASPSVDANNGWGKCAAP